MSTRLMANRSAIERNLIIELHGNVNDMNVADLSHANNKRSKNCKKWLERYLQSGLIDNRKPPAKPKITNQAQDFQVTLKVR